MPDPKQEMAKLFDRLIADLEPLRQAQLAAKNNRGWRQVGAAIQLVTAVKQKVLAFRD